MLEPYVKKILASRVYDVAEETPLSPARRLSDRLQCPVRFKREDLQPVFSFKCRGAYNRMAQLTPAELARGVVTASAGNHAQGVALAAQKLGTRAVIVMGRNTPSIKVDAVKRFGARVLLRGDGYDDASTYAQQLVRKQGMTYVHPFDDVYTIAGQGTVGLEIMTQTAGVLGAIFVPVGGGGLIAGIAAYVKYLAPQIRIIGVEAEGSACLAAAMKAGRRVKLPKESLDLFADGVSVAQVGKETFKVARRYVDELVTVNTDEVCAAIKDVFDDTRVLAEPSGALAVAGLKKWVSGKDKGKSDERELLDLGLVAIVSGANVNFDRLRYISGRAELGEQREGVFGVTIPERPGSFLRFCRTLGKRTVTEFNYRYAVAEDAQVYLGVRFAGEEKAAELIEILQAKGYQAFDMSGNEAAKLHVRHMVGGRVQGGSSELLYRFEFPERPGALLEFLRGLGTRFNISLFHYRNDGSAWGRVLVGFTGNAESRSVVDAHLKKIGYRFWVESDNPAYELFLR